MGKKKAAALAAALLLLASAPALAEGGKGTMQIGLSCHYLWPQGDASVFDPAPEYGAIFHYWLNTTTSIMAGVEMISLTAPLEVNGNNEGLNFNTYALMAGGRYQPKLDFRVKPYVELGVGYQNWTLNPDPSFIDSRSGASVLYFAGGGLNYDFRHVLTAGLNVRYLYYPMIERLEREAVPRAGGRYNVISEPFKNVGFVTAGFELVWKFK
jgi:opacity protein-like surface antigen